MDGLTDTEGRNWVKACLAIKCVKDGMIPLVESYCSKHSEYTNQKVVQTCKVVKYTCNKCDIKHLKPFHNRGECTYGRCDCKGNFKLACPENEACGLIYDLIKAAHTSNDPNWSNTDSKLWSTSAWEQVKCYIATPGYKETMNICDADITALIQICLKCNDLESLFNTSIKHLQEVRKIRNEVYHSSKMKVSNDVLTDVFNHTVTCLMVVANKYPNCTEINHQLGVLQRLKSEEFILTTQHESDAVKDAMVGMHHYMAEITDNQRHTGETIKTLSLGLDDLAKKCDTRFAENATETYRLLNDHTSKIDAVIQREMENEVKIKESEKRNKALFERVNALEETLKSMISINQEQAQHTPRRTEVSLESKITIHAEGIDSEEHFTERIGNAADNIIKQKPLNTSNVVLKNYLSSSLQIVQKDDNRIIDHREKCLEIYIESPSIHNWMTLCEDFFNGIITTAFREVQRYLRTYEGWENLTLRLELDDEYFAHSVHAVIDHLDRALSNVQSSDTTAAENRGIEVNKLKVMPNFLPGKPEIVDAAFIGMARSTSDSGLRSAPGTETAVAEAHGRKQCNFETMTTGSFPQLRIVDETADMELTRDNGDSGRISAEAIEEEFVSPDSEPNRNPLTYTPDRKEKRTYGDSHQLMAEGGCWHGESELESLPGPSRLYNRHCRMEEGGCWRAVSEPESVPRHSRLYNRQCRVQCEAASAETSDAYREWDRLSTARVVLYIRAYYYCKQVKRPYHYHGE